jgi:hypothetical protein
MGLFHRVVETKEQEKKGLLHRAEGEVSGRGAVSGGGEVSGQAVDASNTEADHGAVSPDATHDNNLDEKKKQ